MGLAVGITAVLLPAAGACAAIPALGGLLLFLLATAHYGGSPGRPAAAAALVGALLALLHWFAPWQTLWPLLPRPTCGAEIQAVITDPACPGTPTAELTATALPTVPLLTGDTTPLIPPAAGLRAVVNAVRFAPDQPWYPCHAPVILRLPKTGLPGVAYGVVIQADGAFSAPAPALFTGDFDYAFYLRLNGIRAVFTATDVRLTGPGHGWRRLIAAALASRDRAATALTRQLTDPGNARLLAAILFGTAQPLDAKTRGIFLRSGTIHIFSVSGLNVAILASLLLVLLRLAGLPYAWRYAVLPLPTGLYVIMTGAAPPAVRAWVMLAVWALARARLRPASPLNTIAAAAGLLLLASPLDLGQTGFQFSFLLVLFLILGWQAAGRFTAAAAEADRWRPPESRRPFNPAPPIRDWLWRNLGAGLAGWLAGAGLIAWYNQLFIPASLPVNLAISGLAWLALAGGLFKIALGWLPGLGWLDLGLAQLLEACIIAMRALAAWGGQAPASLPLPRPPAWTVVAYYAALLTACRPWLNWRWRVAGGGVAVLCLSLWLAAPWSPRPPRVALCWGEGAEPPAIALLPGHGQSPALLLTGGPARARRLANWLRFNGYDQADAVIFLDASPEAALALETLAGAITVRAAAAPAGPGPGPLRLQTVAAATGNVLRLGTAAPTADGITRLRFTLAGVTASLSRSPRLTQAGLT
ncbi:MAG: ComEC/Rec2 family competence protein, partial [bacterium]